MNLHTPGPWNWMNYPDGRKLLIGPNNAVIHCPNAPIEISKEDQDLIEATPDLLAACKSIVERFDEQKQNGHTRVILCFEEMDIESLRKAIARAEGGTD